MGDERGGGGGGGRGSSAPSGVRSAVGGVTPNGGDAELRFLYLTHIHNASLRLNLESGEPHPASLRPREEVR